MSPGTNAGVQVAVPPASAITIRAAKLWWYVPQQGSGATTFALAVSNGGVLGESATPLERRGSPDVYVLPSATTSLTLDDYCSNDDAGQGCSFGGGENPDLLLFGSQLTLQDDRLPGGSVSGGGLTGSAPVSGVQSIAFNAEDGDSGVRLAQLLIDGAAVAQSDYAAQCPYANFLACPSSQSGAISWNSASVPDGQHSVALVIENAAQSSRTIYASAITTRNGQGAGSAGGANGLNASVTALLRLGLSRSVSRSYSRSAVVVSGRLGDIAGRPIAGATLDLMQRSVNGGAMHLVSHTQTRADGTFVAAVPRGPSRRIEVAYRASASDADYAVRASIQENVAAGVKLAVSPRRTGAGGRIVLSGRVAGPLPRQGVLVGLLVHYRGRWEPFRTPRTDAHGRFRVAYQFQGGVGRFPFRAQVFGGQAGFPYVHGESATVAVTTS